MDVNSLRPFFWSLGLENREGQEAENSGPLEVMEEVEEEEGADCLSTQEGGACDEQDCSHLQ